MRVSNLKSLKLRHWEEWNKENETDKLFQVMKGEWYDKGSKKRKGICPLFITAINSLKWNAAFVFMLSIVLTIAKVNQINLWRTLIWLFKKSDDNNDGGFYFNRGISVYIYSALFLTNKLVQIILTHHANHQSQMWGAKANNSWAGWIYEKLMRTAIFIKNRLSEGEWINFIQVDVETIGFVFAYAPLTIVVPFQFAIYLYLLFTYFGLSFIIGVLILLFLIVIAWFIQKLYISNQRKLLKNKDERMKITANVLHMLKALKLYSWEEEFMNKINTVRVSELKSMKKIQNVYVLSCFVHWSIPLFVSVSSIGLYTLLVGKMPIENWLTSIEIFDSMSYPLYRLPIFITSVLNCLISMKRLENFLRERDTISSSREDKTLKKEGIEIKFTNCDFGINSRKYPKSLLKNINMEIVKGDLILVFGDTGSGKTCLANAIINFLEYIPKKDGSRSDCVINGTVSYSSQNPWIMNGSIRDNILFYNFMDKDRYEKILKICQLNADWLTWPGGEWTEVSSNGTNISGGQKARISLARAVYQQADIYIFDDPLSSVDSINSYEIFNNVIVEYLSNKTRILIKHDISNIQLMNKIIYMDKGRITWSGVYSDFIKTPWYSELLKQIDKKAEKKGNQINIEKQKNTKTWTNRKITIGNESERIEKGKWIKDEEMKTGKIAFDLYKTYLLSFCGIGILVILILLSFAIQASKIGSNLWLSHWSANREENLFSYLIYTQFGLFSIFFLFLKEFIFSGLVVDINYKWHNKMLKAIIYAPINLFHDIIPSGQCINRLSNDLDKWKLILRLLSQILKSCFTLFGAIYVCTKYSAYSLFSAPLMIILGYYITKYYINAGRDLNRLEGISRTPIVTCFSETISGISTIRSFGTQSNFLKRFFKHWNNCYLVNMFKFGTSNWYALHLEWASFIYLFAIVICAMTTKDIWTAEAIGLMLKYSISFSEQMLNTWSETTMMEKSMVSFERCYSYTQIIQEKARILGKDKNYKNWPDVGNIRFRNYTARYRPEADLVLNNINIDIMGGEKIGIVGKSGSGKSSLVLSCFRWIEQEQGDIIIDNVKISTLGLKVWRANLSVVPQEPILFEGNWRDNIDPLHKYTDDEIIEVLDELEFFDSHYRTKDNQVRNLKLKIKELGNNLSLGEKQWICFARVMLKKSKIVFWDEATSSLDQKIEEIIYKAMGKYFRFCTVLNIWHRVESVKYCDRVIVLDKGRVVEFDKPEILLKNKESLFADLYYTNMRNNIE